MAALAEPTYTATNFTIISGASAAPLALEVFSDDGPWAMTRRRLRATLRAKHHPDFAALAARLGSPVDGGSRNVQNHNGTAVIDIRGPLFRYRSIFTWLLGGTAISDASLDLHAAVDDSSVKAIVLAINSPGGQIDGINALANYIREANAVKPVTAYVDGLAGSGAYWLAAAAGKIVSDETSQLGSIGVLATVEDDSEAEGNDGVKRYVVISSQSPLKRTDPSTDEGRAQLQQMVDGLAQLFIEKVAQFRGTTPEEVQSDFGRGAVMNARAAVAAGMADSIGSLQSLLAPESFDASMQRIRDNPTVRVAAPETPVQADAAAIAPLVTPQAEGHVVAAAPFDEQELEDETEDQQLNNDSSCHCPPGTETCNCGGDDSEDEGNDDDDDDEAQGTEQQPDESSIPRSEVRVLMPTEERQRIAAILNCEEARGREELARALALETDMTPEAATKILKASPVATKPAANALETRMGQLPNPQIGTGETGQDATAAEVARILAFVPKERLRAHARS